MTGECSSPGKKKKKKKMESQYRDALSSWQLVGCLELEPNGPAENPHEIHLRSFL